MKEYISKQTLIRIPMYLSLLQEQSKLGVKYISATTIANLLQLNHVQVRKDLSCTSTAGKPKVGYETKVLINDIEKFLGYKKTRNAILIGAGGLGKTLLGYDGFSNYGLNLIAGFDNNITSTLTLPNSKQIYHVDNLVDFIDNNNIQIGVITTPKSAAQQVCDLLVEHGIKGIWNFSPITLNAPQDVIIQNENMAIGLAVLSNKLNNK